MLMINRYYFDGDNGGGGVMMVVVVRGDCHLDDQRLDNCRLLVLLPVPHQQHGGILMEIRVDRENEKFENAMTRE